MITIRDLTVTVRGTDRVLIRDLSLDVPQTHITGVIGPSGAGKSTLLKCINRLIDFMPTLEVRGTILIDGVDVRDPSIDPDDLRRRVGIVFQQPVTFHGSIRRNVTFAARKLDIVTRHNEDEVLESCAPRICGTK
jgi:phosphate transport system ATP-binding protein